MHSGGKRKQKGRGYMVRIDVYDVHDSPRAVGFEIGIIEYSVVDLCRREASEGSVWSTEKRSLEQTSA